MFLTDEDGQFGPELSFIQAVFGMSWFCGSLVGGFAYGTEAFKLFKAENKQTMFENPRDAQQAMRVRKAMMRHARAHPNVPNVTAGGAGKVHGEGSRQDWRPTSGRVRILRHRRHNVHGLQKQGLV